MIIKHGGHIFGEIYKLRKGLWAFFLIVCFGCWLAGQANSNHVVFSCLNRYDKQQQQQQQRNMVGWIHVYVSVCSILFNLFLESLLVLFSLTQHSLFNFIDLPLTIFIFSCHRKPTSLADTVLVLLDSLFCLFHYLFIISLYILCVVEANK